MLSDEYIANISMPLIEIYADLETELIENISRRIAGTNFLTPFAEWEVEKLQQMNLLNKQNIKSIAKSTKHTQKAVRKLIEDAGYKVLDYDEKTYRQALKTGQLTVEAVPLNMSPILKNILNASIKNALHSFNLTNTTALTSSQSTFYNSVNKAYLEVINGIKPIEKAIRDSVKDMASKGISGAKYPTRSDHMDVVVRRNIVTTIGQTTAQLVMARAKDWGNNLVEVSSHAGARPTHAEWQGDIYMLEGSSSKYANLEDSTGYGKVDGLCGANCKHQFFAFVEGVSEPAYEKYDEQENKKIYEESQQQRKIEREIRKYKREKAGLEAIGQDSLQANTKIKEKQKEMRDFINSTGRTRRPAREQIAK